MDEIGAKTKIFPTTILVIVLILDIVAFAAILPLFPSLIDFYAADERKDWLYNIIDYFITSFQDALRIPVVHSTKNVIFGGLLGSIFCILQFLSSPILGALSDSYGRKPVFIFTLVGTLTSYLIWSKAESFAVFLFSRIIGGVCKTSLSISLAMVSDLYTEDTIGKGMALVGLCFSIGFIVGPMLGAYFSYTQHSLQGIDIAYTRNAPAQMAVYITIVEIVLIVFMMPETFRLNPSKRHSLKISSLKKLFLYINPIALLNFCALETRITPTNLRKMQSYGRIYFIYLLLYSGLEFTLSFVTHIRYGYTSMQQGKMYLYIGVLMIAVQGGFLRRLSNQNQIYAACVAIFLLIPSYLIIAFTHSMSLFYLGLSIYAIASAIVVPAVTSSVSNLSSKSTKGTTLGVLRCLGALARSFGPFLASLMFWLIGDKLCYAIGGLLFFIPFFMLLNIIRGRDDEKRAVCVCKND